MYVLNLEAGTEVWFSYLTLLSDLYALCLFISSLPMLSLCTLLTWLQVVKCGIVELYTNFLPLEFYSFNLRYIFPGLALGAALGQSGVVTNAMINRSAEALVELISEEVRPLK